MINKIKCFFGFHKLIVQGPLSRQSALFFCRHCGRRYAVMMKGEHEGASIEYTPKVAEFYKNFVKRLDD
jgi:hypothetical protein